MFKHFLILIIKLTVAAVLAIYELQANAVESFIVQNIRINGLKNIEPSSIYSYLTIKQGDIYNDDKASEAIHALYKTGFFKNIQIFTQGNDVIVQVKERCIIAAIELAGIKELDNNSLTSILHTIGIKVGRYYDKELFYKAKQEIKLKYLSLGFYGTEVEAIITPIDTDRVHVLFSIVEGPRAKICQINFIGNKKFSTKILAKEMQLSTLNLFSWYTKDNIYIKEKLIRDLEKIRSYYLNRGYLEFNIKSTRVSISNDKKDVFLTITLHEGKPYTISNIKLNGNLLNHDKELQKLVKIKAKDCFSAEKLQQTEKLISDKLSQYGYALVTIKAQPEIDQENHEVSLTLIVDPGYRMYVRRVNIIGNKNTRDEVIRREVHQLEGSWFNSKSIELSNNRLNRLGYFTKVEISTTPVKGIKDQVDVNITVNEKNTGAITFGAGFSKTDKISLSANLSHDNIFGSGIGLLSSINTAKKNRTLTITQIDPYFTMEGINRVTDIYYRKYRIPSFYSSNDANSNFEIINIGGKVKFGIPFSEDDIFYLSAGIEQNRIDTDSIIPDVYKIYINNSGRVSTIMPLTIEWLRDSRDSNILPSKGYFIQASAEYSIPIYKLLSYYKFDMRARYYHTLPNDFILSLNLQGGYMKGIEGSSYPIFKSYYAGGSGSVRGYEKDSLGSRDKMTKYFIGGSKIFVGNIELTFPLLNMGNDMIDAQKIRVFTFLDGGNVWGSYSGSINRSANKMRYSYGIGLFWVSPIGPLKISLGFPIQKHIGDRYQKLQFQLGTSL
ncbi:MAG: outer membrane protein assembly factor BamA [Burkholderia sp.]|nr:outer membrane protein assembly factor BamA [Burkholderia sp.]